MTLLSVEMIRPPSLAMQQYSIEPITAKYEKGYGFLSFYHLLKKIKKTIVGHTL